MLACFFKNQVQEVVQCCPFKTLDQEQVFMTQLGATEFIIYQEMDGRIEVRCLTKSYQSHFLGANKVIVPPGCRENTNHFVFDGEIDVMIQDDIVL